MLVSECTLIRPVSCRQDEDIAEVASKLRDNKQRRIIVVDNNESPIGIISTTDINNKVVAENKDPKNLKAEDIMTSPIYLVCDINDGLDMIFRKMVEHESFFCPVTDNQKLYGILTYGELVNKIHEKVRNESK